MNSKQKKTLADIFHKPVKISILWSDVESLFKAFGAHIEEGSGSRVCIMSLNSLVAEAVKEKLQTYNPSLGHF